MYCGNCGQNITEKVSYCPNCGERITAQPNQIVSAAPRAETTKSTGKKKKGKKKLTGCLIVFIFAVIIVAAFLIIGILGGSDETTTISDSTANSSVETAENKKTYKIGDTVTVKTDRGEYSLKFTGVRETNERNEFADENPKRVVILEYEYKNISFDSDVVVSYLYFRAYDKDGNALTVYPDASVKQTTNISQGKKATASVAYGLDSTENSVTVDFYDITYENIFNSECTFNLTW